MIHQTIWLVKKELKYHRTPFFFTMVVTVIFGMLGASFLEPATRHLFGAESVYYPKFAADILFIFATPSFGALFISGPYLSYRTIKDDPFTKRMAFFRSLPIPVHVLANSRTIIMLIILAILSVIYYLTIVFSVPASFFDYFSIGEFLIFSLLWFGYGLALAGMNPFLEYGTNGKMLHLAPFIFLGICMAAIFPFYFLSEYTIVEASLLAVKTYRWPVALIALGVGIVGSIFWKKLLVNRLRNRDYL